MWPSVQTVLEFLSVVGELQLIFVPKQISLMVSLISWKRWVKAGDVRNWAKFKQAMDLNEWLKFWILLIYCNLMFWWIPYLFK